MNCADVEILLCDYLDGTLAPEQRTELESHLGNCALCAEFAMDAGAGLNFLEHVPDVQPPQELVTRIMHQAPAGGLLKSLDVARGGGGFKKWLNRMLEPIRQPRYVYGAMMTILSLSMMTRCAGVPVRDLKAEDLNPERVWVNLETKVERVYDRTIKTYQSMRLVYEVRQELRQWREQQQEQDAAAPAEIREIKSKTPDHPTGQTPSEPAGKN
jgi:hypothetical protein